MRRQLCLVLWSILALVGFPVLADAPFHIGVVTSSIQTGEDSYRGAEALLKEYGSVGSGGMIQHLTYPDDYLSEQEAYISSLAALADDPTMKAIVVNQAIPGTAAALVRLKAKRPDILCLVGEADEAPSAICPVADLVVNLDFISRGYTIVWAAKQMGAKTFVHFSVPRFLAYEGLARRFIAMQMACKEMGLLFVSENI